MSICSIIILLLLLCVYPLSIFNVNHFCVAWRISLYLIVVFSYFVSWNVLLEYITDCVLHNAHCVNVNSFQFINRRSNTPCDVTLLSTLADKKLIRW